MGERSNSLYARRDTATKIDREPKTSSGADSRERPAPIPSGDINAGVHGSCEHSVHVERLHVVSSTTPHSLCAHDRIHHIPLEENTCQTRGNKHEHEYRTSLEAHRVSAQNANQCNYAILGGDTT